MDNNLSPSGIYSLGGFAFQIRVFVYYMLELKEDMQLEFETIEDVNMKTLNHKNIDKYEENFTNKISGNTFNKAIQVKRTKITESNSLKIILNWMLLESSGNNISSYTLFTHDEHENKDILFNVSAQERFKIIIDSKKSSTALVTKVKKKYKDKFNEFEQHYESIKSKYEFISVNDIDKKIEEGFSTLFRKAANKIVYFQRLKELHTHMTAEIINSVNLKLPYVFSYTEFMKLIDDISLRFTEKITQPVYYDFKSTNKIDLNDSKVIESREYIQLITCKLTQQLLENHLSYGGYYQSMRLQYMEKNQISKIMDIEGTTYDNFLDVKHNLQIEQKDQPYNRLEEIKKRSNSYAENEQIKYGSGIYLTRKENNINQISWEDKDNEKP